jgi:YjbE family integral membrane protein
MLDSLSDPAFWQALGAIVWVNLLLSGDNAVVIALAARSLPRGQRRVAVIGGSAAAIVMRALLTAFAVALLQVPGLKLAGAALLLWVGVRLLIPETAEGEVETSRGMLQAIRTILIADLVMSLDNVVAVAAAADQGPPEAKLALLGIGLGLSVPIVVFGSALMLRVTEQFPIVITLGAALLGWIAGEISVTDPAVAGWVSSSAPWLYGYKLTAIVGAAGVVALGKWLAARYDAAAARQRAGKRAARGR